MGSAVFLHLSRHTEYHTLQFGNQLVTGLAGKLFHVLHVHTGFFCDGYSQSFAGGVNGSNRLMGLDGTLGKHIRLALQFAVLVYDLQSTEQIVTGIIGKGQSVCPVIDKAVLGGEIIIESVQLCLLLPDVAVRRGGVHLQINELLDTFPQTHQPFHAGLSGGVQVRPHHTAVFTVIHITVHNGVGVVFYIGVSGNRSVDGFVLAQFRQLGLLVGAANILHGIVQLIGQLQALDGVHGVVHAVSGAFRFLSAQHHLRVVQEIAVDGKAVLGLSGLRPFLHNVQRTPSPLEEDNIRDHFGPSIGLERSVGQTDSSQQLGALGQIPAHGGILGVHRVAGSHKGHYAAGPHLIQRLGKKVVVDVEAQLVVGFVVDLILTERHIADGKVIEVPPVGGLEPRHGDVGFGIKLSSNPPADGIQLHTVQLASGHALRQHPEEIAHTTGRLQNVSGLEPHVPHGLVNGPNHRGAGVVGVEGGPSGSGVFLRGQQLLQLRILRSPRRLLRVKDVGNSTPTHILRKQMLLLQGSVTVFLLNLFQRGNGLDVAPELLLRPTCAQVIIHDAEIPRRRLRGRFWPTGLLGTRTQSFSRRFSVLLIHRFGI